MRKNRTTSRKSSALFTNSQLGYLLGVGWFYVSLYCYTWNSAWCQQVLGYTSRAVPITILSLSALLSLCLFFWSTISSATARHWQRVTWFNAILLSIPLYFLWLRFIL